MKAHGRWRRVLLVDDDEHRRATLVRSPVRFLQITGASGVREALNLLQGSPFDALLLAEDLLSPAVIPGLLTLREQQPFLRFWLLRHLPQPGPLHEIVSPEAVFHWPVSVTDIHLALASPSLSAAAGEKAGARRPPGGA